MIVGAAKVGFVDTKAGIDEAHEICYLTSICDQAVPVNWDDSKDAGIGVSDLEKDTAAEAAFEEVPAVAGKAKSYQSWSKNFVAFLYGHEKLELQKSPSTGELSKSGESERDFRVRLQPVSYTHLTLPTNREV